jgi:GH18 family chitinase
MNLWKSLAGLFLFSLAFNACTAPVISSTPTIAVLPMATNTPPTSHHSFRIIGYATDAILVENIPFERLTHINYAFLIPNADGTFAPLTKPSKVHQLVEQGHAHGVKVLISIGGWGWDAQFEEIAASPERRAVFIREALKVVDEYSFDGADIDWEYPDPGQSAKNYLELMSGLRVALPDKLLTTAVISYGDEIGLGIPSETFPLLDFVNAMTYDGPDHATMQQFQKGLDYWLGRGVPREKLVMGLPFYTRPGEVSYGRLARDFPAASQSDTFNYNGQEEHYNGIPSVRQKTLLALDRASGIMFWTLEHDASGDASLLTAINQTVASYKP